MKRTAPIDIDVPRTLARLQEEFLSAAASCDGPFIRLTLNKASLTRPSGALDDDLLKRIGDAVIDGRQIVLNEEWAEDPELGTCSKEMVVCRYGQSAQFFSQFEELAAGTLRTLARVAPVAKEFGLDVEEGNAFSLSRFWLDLLMTLGSRREHPIVFASDGPLRHEFGDDQHASFSFGEHAILFMTPEPEAVQRMKAAAQAETSCQELQCGVMRASAYAIDWLLGIRPAKPSRISAKPTPPRSKRRRA